MFVHYTVCITLKHTLLGFCKICNKSYIIEKTKQGDWLYMEA